MLSVLRSMPDRLLAAVVGETASGGAGRAVALAFLCFLYPERHRQKRLDTVPGPEIAETLEEALRERGVDYLTRVSVEHRGPGMVTFKAEIRNALGFQLDGRKVVLGSPEWLERDTGLEVTGYDAVVKEVVSTPTSELADGTLAACEAAIEREEAGPERAAVYLKSGGTVLERFVYDTEDLFAPHSSMSTKALSAGM